MTMPEEQGDGPQISYTGPERQKETHEEWRKRNLRELLAMHQRQEIDEETYIDRLDAIVNYYELQSRVDPLTGIANLRQFETQLEAEQLKMIADGTYQGHLLFFDADGLREANNTYGHNAGNNLIKAYAKTVSDVCKEVVQKNFASKPRISAFAGRIGGDEIVAFLGDLNDDEALEVANQIRDRVNSSVNEIPQFKEAGWNQTISGGIQRLNGNSDPEQVRKDADNAAYVAKTRGKNQIVPYGKITPQERIAHSAKFK